MKNYLHALAFLLILMVPQKSMAQLYSEPFVQSVTATTACTNWNTFRAGLTTVGNTSVKMSGTYDVTGITCNDPTISDAIANALKTGTNYLSPSVNGHVWSVYGTCFGYIGVWIDPGSMCNPSDCPSPGYLMRPCLANLNWGGVNTATCSAPSQTMILEFTSGPPCPVPTAVAASPILSSSATIHWGAVPGSVGYEYIVNTTAGNPITAGTATTATSVPVSGLTPSTTYYIHVRNKCSATSISVWVNVPFTTLPPCHPPVGFNTTNLQPTSTDINWAAWPSATDYDYIVDQSSATPIGSTGSINTVNTTAPIPGLTENTKYYVHIRCHCVGNETSDWSLDSFVTPIPCRAPEILITHINTDEAVAYWNAVPTAFEYVYAIDKSATPPAIGTKYNYTSIHTSALSDGVVYYIHVQATCNSVGVISSSPWATATFKTFPAGINDQKGATFTIAVFPNPVKDALEVNLSGARDGDANIQLTDMSGKVIRTVNVTSDKVNMNTAGISPGVYFIKYTDQSRNDMVKITKL